MTPKERAAMQQALEALEVSTDWDVGAKGKQLQSMKAITALREALKPTREGKYYYKDNACTADNADSPDCICWHDEALAEQAEQGPYAYEVWDANDQVLILIYASCLKEFYWIEQDDIARKLYAAPVRTKDLTDDEIEEIGKSYFDEWSFGFARAVIAADREKNRG